MTSQCFYPYSASICTTKDVLNLTAHQISFQDFVRQKNVKFMVESTSLNLFLSKKKAQDTLDQTVPFNVLIQFFGERCQRICNCDNDTCDISTGCKFLTTGILFCSNVKNKIISDSN